MLRTAGQDTGLRLRGRGGDRVIPIMTRSSARRSRGEAAAQGEGWMGVIAPPATQSSAAAAVAGRIGVPPRIAVCAAAAAITPAAAVADRIGRITVRDAAPIAPPPAAAAAPHRVARIAIGHSAAIAASSAAAGGVIGSPVRRTTALAAAAPRPTDRGVRCPSRRPAPASPRPDLRSLCRISPRPPTRRARRRRGRGSLSVWSRAAPAPRSRHRA